MVMRNKFNEFPFPMKMVIFCDSNQINSFMKIHENKNGKID